MKRSGTQKWLKIISGGQSGVDRAALDAAISLGFSCGGSCPRGRLAEDGPIPKSYPLKELRSPSYAARTRINVEDSDATLVLCDSEPSGGTALTIDLAMNCAKPLLVVDLNTKRALRIDDLVAWLVSNDVKILNVAGPRESGSPGIYEKSLAFMTGLLNACLKNKLRN